MKKNNVLNIITVLLLLYALWFKLPWYISVLIVLVYIGIIAYASAQIKLNFFLKAFNSNKSHGGKTICLTFDDGPHAELTPQILKLLDEFSVKASFFVIGKNIEGNEALLRNMHSKGHLIGNHSFNHKNNFPILSQKEIIKELDLTANTIESIISKKPNTFRPPFGVTNPRIASAVQHLKYKVLGWNIRSFDTKRKNPKETLNRIIAQCKPGSVVLLHDNIPETIQVLREFLVFLKVHEYQVILPDEMFKFDWYQTN